MKTRLLVYTALMTAIIAVMGFVPAIPLPFIPVPIVLQNIGIFLAGMILGRKYGTLSVLVFLLLVLCGAPLLSGGRGGIGVLMGPSAGFLIMYPIVTYLMGWMRDRHFNDLNVIKVFLIILIFGVVLLDVVGAIVMGFVIHMPISKALVLSLTFLPGDIIKAIIASIIAMALIKNPVTGRIFKNV
ncbi:biotin transporter BioY [Staphylococcus chromogenes]|uniref:biotin transporter BioY n=1 Tax=Staphylococcus chromogenes TaxID=46126 RepID=UPI001E2DAD3A|nr:biotin transporter BioY [Staphylococcus chromogenes]MCD8904813.1 biotin transporter BioY [Staphylococcus chromogenes]MEB7825177.1 biotin transporter BioY [Staphylococcus chromogenes]UXS68399.1 biotin transporter BioY [Staphylococcus chromogenes]